MRESDLQALETLSTATLTTVLLKRGLRNVWLRGPRPLQPGRRIAGPAFTLRFIPAREDLTTSPILRSTRNAIEAMPPGCIAVADTAGVNDVGIFGDILCQRMQLRGVSALVTDGAVRDADGVVATGLPVWCNGVAAPPGFASLAFANWQEPIGCGGVAVVPGDIVVADSDGAVIIPAGLVAEVLPAALEQEKLEQWISEEVRSGASLPGLYPPDEDSMRRYKAYRAAKNGSAS